MIAVGGVPQIFFGIFTPENGEDEPVFDSYFSKGLKPPTSDWVGGPSQLVVMSEEGLKF